MHPHQFEPTSPISAAAPKAPPAECESSQATGAFEQQLSEAESLVNELKRILVRHESTLDEEGIREEIEIIERWAESYRRGMKAASKLSEQGCELLEHVRERLKLAADEITRMEDEGPATPEAAKESARKAEDFLKASRRIGEVLPHMQNIVSPQDADHTNKESEEA